MTNDEIEIDLLKILKTWLKKAWIIVLVAAVLGGGMFCYSNASYVPTYTTNTTLYASYVNTRDFAFGDNDGNISQTSISEARSIVNTCNAVLKTRMTLDAVIKEAGVDMTSNQLASKVTVAAVNSSEVFTVTVTGTNAEELVRLANAIGKVLPEHVAMINSNSKVSVIDEALTATISNGNDAMKTAALAAVLGAFAVCGVIAVQCVVDDIKKAKKNK